MRIRLAECVALLMITFRLCFAQGLPEGVFQGYDGEWKHVSAQLIALAEATPAEKFTWHPAQGVRSTSEVYMHIVFANFLMLDALGHKMPADFKREMTTTVTAKADVIRWLKQSLEAVKEAHAAENPIDLPRKLQIFGANTTADASICGS